MIEDVIFDPKKSFFTPSIFSTKEGTVELGKYTPTIDAVKLFVAGTDEEKNIRNMAQYLSITLDELGKAVLIHEVNGHALLARGSSFWLTIYGTNICTSITFNLLMHNFEKFRNHPALSTSLERNLSGILWMEMLLGILCEVWRPIHETFANLQLLMIHQLSADKKIREVCKKLVEVNTKQDRIVEKLTIWCEYVIKELGEQYSYELLTALMTLASSPKMDFLPPVNDPETLKKLKKERYLRGYEMGRKDPASFLPTMRFENFLKIVIKCIDEIKVAIKRGRLRDALMGIIRISTQDIEPLSTSIEKFFQLSNSISSNPKFEDWRRWAHERATQLLEPLKKAIQTPSPTFWFVKESKTGKYIFGMKKIVEEYPVLEEYLMINVMKNQFLNSFRSGENNIKCFEKQLSICQKGCSPCIHYTYTKKASRFTDYIIKNYSFDELLAMGKEYFDNYFENL